MAEPGHDRGLWFLGLGRSLHCLPKNIGEPVASYVAGTRAAPWETGGTQGVCPTPSPLALPRNSVTWAWRGSTPFPNNWKLGLFQALGITSGECAPTGSFILTHIISAGQRGRSSCSTIWNSVSSSLRKGMGKAATDHFLFSFKQGSCVSLLPAHGGYGPPSFMLLPKFSEDSGCSFCFPC